MRFALVTLGLFGLAIVSAAPGSPLNITSVNGDSGCHWYSFLKPPYAPRPSNKCVVFSLIRGVWCECADREY